MCAITNPLVNSYKRLVPGYEAPCYLAWSASNRSALIRIPAARGNSTRVELRNPDPSCNPYLTLAACLAAGLDGIERKLLPPEEITENIFEMNAEERAANGIEDLPDSLEHALVALKADPLLAEVLGPHILPPIHRREGEGVGGVLHPRLQLGDCQVHGPILSLSPSREKSNRISPGFVLPKAPRLPGRRRRKSKNFSGFGLN